MMNFHPLTRPSLRGLALMSAVGMVGLAFAAVPYAEGFEDPSFSAPLGLPPGPGWFAFNSQMTRVPSGNAGISSIEGSHHAVITPPLSGSSGVFSRLGGYSNTFNGGYITSIDVYIDLNDPAVIANTYGWDLSVASNNQAGSHRRDFIFHAASNASGQVLIGASNNSNFARRNDLASINHYTITTSGWYRFEHVFRDNGSGVLAVDLRLRNTSNGQVLWTETRSDASDLIATVVGGNRYMWFTFLATANLPVDNVRTRSLARVVNNFGWWRSGDTRSPAGVVQRGSALSHEYHPNRSGTDDAQIARQLIFMGEGQNIPSFTTGVPGPSPSGSLAGLGYVRLDGTNSINGKTDITTYNANGLGLTNSIFAPGFTASYRYFTQSLNTARTPGFSFYGFDPASNRFFSLTYVQTAYSPNSWNTATVDENSAGWSARVNFAPLPGGLKSIADWKADPAAAAIFSPSAFIYEHGFNLGSSQRECVVYLDWMQMSTLYDGDVVDFRSTPNLLNALPVDLNGTYSAPGASTTSNAIASATTFPSSNQVVEQAAGASVVEGTFTPFSDASKQPAALTGLNMVGRSYTFDVDVLDTSLWTVGQEYFQVGLGTGVGYANGTPEAFVGIRKAATGFEIFHSSNRSGAVSTSYISAADNTRFRIEVSIDGTGANASLNVTPLNGTGAGIAVNAGLFPLDLLNDNVTSASFFAGFSSDAATANRARVALSNFRTNATTNSQFVFAGDPYNRSTESVVYGLGQANLNPAMGGFQSFLQLVGAMSFSSRNYTAFPYPQRIATTNWFDLNGVIANNAALVTANANLADLAFTGANGASGSISIRTDNGSGLPTLFSDGDGNEISPTRHQSNVALFDDVAPVPATLSATQGTLSVLSNPVMTGMMSLSLTSSDALSGLDRHPTVTIDFAPVGAGPEDVTLNTASSTGNTFTASYNVPVSAPNGPGQIIVSSVDRAGNTQSQAFPINVNTATVTLNLSLDLVTASVTRGVEIRLGKNGGSGSPLVLSRNVNFTSGAATVVFNALDGIPSDANITNYQISAKDTLHTLRSRADVTGTGNSYSGTLVLRGGNLNGDGRIDIGDYVVYATRFGIAVSPNTPFVGMATSHSGSLRHADISGDGAVDAADFSYIATQFGLQFDDPEVGGMARPDRTVRQRITVKDAIQESGSKRAASYDLDGDGWITMQEMQRVLRGLR